MRRTDDPILSAIRRARAKSEKQARSPRPAPPEPPAEPVITRPPEPPPEEGAIEKDETVEIKAIEETPPIDEVITDAATIDLTKPRGALDWLIRRE